MVTWSSSYITALPDSAFACVDSSGRHYPHHNAAGEVDLPHLRNALSRLGQDDTTSCGASHLRAHARAEGIGKAMTETLKAEQLGTGKWRVLAIPFGGPLKGGKDLDGEFFSERSDIKPDWFPERPVLWHHGQDDTVGDDEIGRSDQLTKGPDGWWARVWLDRQTRYFDKIAAMMDSNRMFGSSATMGHLVKKARSGEILVWPYIEQTLSPIPINAFSVVRPIKAFDDFASAGIEMDPAFKGLISDLAETPDLGPDLSSDGDDPAMERLAAALDQLDAVIRRVP